MTSVLSLLAAAATQARALPRTLDREQDNWTVGSLTEKTKTEKLRKYFRSMIHAYTLLKTGISKTHKATLFVSCCSSKFQDMGSVYFILYFYMNPKMARKPKEYI